MKTLFFSLIFSCIITITKAQAGSYSYTNGATNTIPGNPGQPAELYNGVPSGQPNTINTNTVIVPNSSFITTPTMAPTTGTSINYQQPQSGTLDNPYSTSPTNSMLTTPSYTPKNNVNHLALFQDPAKTPKNPKQATHVGTVDGSSGKYKNSHVDHHNKNDFAKNTHHIKKTKHHAEKTSGKTYEPVGNK